MNPMSPERLAAFLRTIADENPITLGDGSVNSGVSLLVAASSLRAAVVIAAEQLEAYE